MSVRIWCLERSDNQNFRFLSSEMFRQHCDNLQQHIRAKQLPKDVTSSRTADTSARDDAET